MSKGKGKMNWETKLIRCKMKLDKVALREPRTGKDFLNRDLWERVRRILIRRYKRLD
mgnify:CR=1 FL=1|jgi:hypothetical protein